MNRGVHGKHHPEGRQACGDGRGHIDFSPESNSDQGRECGEHRTPELHSAHTRGAGLPPEPSQGRGAALHEAVTDHPEAKEAADLPEVPAQGRLKKDRQGHHEPDIPGSKQKEAGH